MNFKDKIIVITGASSGIGKSLAINLAKLGSTLALISRSEEKLKSTLDEISHHSPNSKYFICDIKNLNQVKKTFQKIISNFKRIDTLINNAGIGYYKPFQDSTQEEIQDQIDTNLYGTINCIKSTLPQMIKQNSGQIINISSVSGKSGFPNIAAYSASKHAIVGLTESLYYELKDHNIKISLICPAAVSTNFYSNETWKKFPHKQRHKNLLSPNQVSKEIIKAIQKNKFETIISLRSKIIILLKNLLPKLYMKKVSKLPR